MRSIRPCSLVNVSGMVRELASAISVSIALIDVAKERNLDLRISAKNMETTMSPKISANPVSKRTQRTEALPTMNRKLHFPLPAVVATLLARYTLLRCDGRLRDAEDTPGHLPSGWYAAG